MLPKCVYPYEYMDDWEKLNETWFSKDFVFEVDVQWSEKLHDLHNDLPFLPERLNIEIIEYLVANLHNKHECVLYR